jgi:hypothetical protein
MAGCAKVSICFPCPHASEAGGIISLKNDAKCLKRVTDALQRSFMRLFWIGIVMILLSACATTRPQTTLSTQATATFSPTSYTTTTGGSGGQPVANLSAQDQSGSQNDWNKYVEFTTPGTAKYAGYRTYTVPSSVTLSTINALQVKANFLGPTVTSQKWTWRIYNWSTASWVVLGDNTGASWSSWKAFTFNATGTLANYVSSSRQIRIRIDSNNVADNADLDYEAVVITHGTTTPPTTSWWQPQKGLKWWWQIENTATLSTNLAVDVYDVDLFEGQDTGKIAALKTAGYKVICYFSAGTYEPFRPDATALFANNGQAIIAGSSLPQFSEEAWLAIGDSAALETIIKPVMRARLDKAKQAGCDAVEPDNVDGYDNEETQGGITSAQQVTYNKWLASEAHSRGLGVGLKNALDLIPQLLGDFDFAINEQCYAYSVECSSYETTFLSQNKAVFNQEYSYPATGDPGLDDGIISQTSYNTSACPYFRSKGMSSLWKNGLNLNGSGVVICN